MSAEVASAVVRLRAWTADQPHDAPRDAQAPRLEVVAAVIDALDSRLHGNHSTTAADVAASLTDGEADVLRIIDELRGARDILHRGLTHTLEPELALRAGDELNDLVDEILRESTDHALRDLRADAFTDVLTGAGNRRAFERDFHRALETSKRHGRHLAVGVLDLDGLKRLNDEHGHGAGDEALRALAAAFLGELRAGDGLYRIGGDEFALVLPESGSGSIEALLDRAEAKAPSFSHGWAAFPQDGETTGALLTAADDRLIEGRHHRRAVVAPVERLSRRGRGQMVAAALPVVVALVLAEVIRRIANVDLGNVLVQSWIGLLALGAVLGPPVARRWCAGHRNMAATALCSSRIALVILLVLVSALFPVHRLRKAMDFAAFQRAHPATSQESPSEQPSGGSTKDESSQFAFGDLPVPAVPSTVVTDVAPPPAISRRQPAPSGGQAFAFTDAPAAAPAPAPTPVPLADIGTKTPNPSITPAPLANSTVKVHGKGKHLGQLRHAHGHGRHSVDVPRGHRAT